MRVRGGDPGEKLSSPAQLFGLHGGEHWPARHFLVGRERAAAEMSRRLSRQNYWRWAEASECSGGRVACDVCRVGAVSSVWWCVDAVFGAVI